MGIDFIAIDFETATSNMNSACSIGIAMVEDLRIVDSFYSLIRPPYLQFDRGNIAIHGITPDMAERAEPLDTIWPSIRWMFTQHCPVVAHNAPFDMSVLRKSTTVDIPDFPFVDSIHMAKPLVSGSKSLASCAQQLNLDLERHHNALADAEACAKIAICALQHSHCIFMWEYLAQNPHVPVRRFSSLHPQDNFYRKPTPKRPLFPSHPRPSEISRSVDSVDRNHPLYGKNLVFTGELSIDREAAMRLAVNAGAMVKSSVSGKTDFLIVGRQDVALVGEDGMSSKEEKAHCLIAGGKANIQIIGEAEFITLAGAKPPTEGVPT